MGSLPLRANRPTHIMLIQVFTCVTIFGLASSAPVDPFTAAAAATVGYLGQTAGTAAIGAAGAGTGLLLKKLVTGDGSFPRLNVGVSPVAELGSVRLGGKVGAGLGGWRQAAGMNHFQTMRLSFCKVNLVLELERQTSTEGWGPVSTMGLPLPRKSLERLKNQLKKRRRGRLSARRSSVLESGFQPMR